MTLNEVKKILKAGILTEKNDLDVAVEWAYCADLMSDVLAYSVTGCLLITGLTNTQVIRTAEVAGLRAVVFVQDKRPDIRTIALAEEKHIPLLSTNYSTFETCGKLFEKGLRSRHYLKVG
jgi:predicted transcriptional regulator